MRGGMGDHGNQNIFLDSKIYLPWSIAGYVLKLCLRFPGFLLLRRNKFLLTLLQVEPDKGTQIGLGHAYSVLA